MVVDVLEMGVEMSGGAAGVVGFGGVSGFVDLSVFVDLSGIDVSGVVVVAGAGAAESLAGFVAGGGAGGCSGARCSVARIFLSCLACGEVAYEANNHVAVARALLRESCVNTFV